MHVHHFSIRDLSTFTVFFHVVSYKTGILENIMWTKTCISIYPTNYDCSISHSKRKWEIYDHKWILIFMQNTSYSSHILMEFEFPQYFLKKYIKIIFRENPSFESVEVSCGLTDRRTEEQMKRDIKRSW